MFQNKIVIGIVGKIGAGKSTVAEIFSQEYGFYQINVDKLGHQALDHNKQQLIAEFGNDILDENRQINRSKLGKLVFSDINKLHLLNNIVHPLMKDEIIRIIKTLPYNKYLIDAALLFEMGLDEICHFILSIEAPEEMIINRVTKNRFWSKEKVLQVLAAQKHLDILKEKCHFIIFNNVDILKLKKQIEFFILEIS